MLRIKAVHDANCTKTPIWQILFKFPFLSSIVKHGLNLKGQYLYLFLLKGTGYNVGNSLILSIEAGVAIKQQTKAECMIMKYNGCMEAVVVKSCQYFCNVRMVCCVLLVVFPSHCLSCRCVTAAQSSSDMENYGRYLGFLCLLGPRSKQCGAPVHGRYR